MSPFVLLAADERGSTRMESEQALATKRHKKHKTSLRLLCFFAATLFLFVLSAFTRGQFSSYFRRR